MLLGLILGLPLLAVYVLQRPGRPVRTDRERFSALAEPGWLPEAREHAWRYVVIHHSATAAGSADVFDRYHRQVRGWSELGYHFVIGNGQGSGDGRVEVGPRWASQKWGAHTGGTPDGEYNNHGIGICLVGDFTSGEPTAAQLAALERLTLFLAGRYGISPGNILGHRDAPGTDTECPGRYLHAHVHGTLRDRIRRALAGEWPVSGVH